jgi:hypothetical protein
MALSLRKFAPNALPKAAGMVPATKVVARCRTSEPAIRYLHVLQEHEDRVTWMAQRWEAVLQVWVDVVVKWYAQAGAAACRNEAECYRALASMQGESIAELLAVDMETAFKGEEQPRVGLMVRWAGSTYDVVPLAGLERAGRILDEMHRLGVAHGDVSPRNMSYDPATGRVVLFDFSEGVIRGEDNEAMYRGACQEDLEFLKEEMDFCRAHPSMSAYYFSEQSGLVHSTAAAGPSPRKGPRPPPIDALETRF